MIELIVSIVVVMLLCGFVYWAYLKLMPLAPIAEPFRGVLDVMVIILIGAVVMFYAIIPLLKALPHLLHI